MNAQPLLNHRYRIIKLLGEGGFGRTFLAEDTHMPSRSRCVIKQLKPTSRRPEVHQLLQDRFAREAAVLEAMGKAHSQIPTLYAYFVRQNDFYLAQEWIDGEMLNANSHGEIENITMLLASLLKTLDYIHSRNIIHRDIKPENIIVRAQDSLPCLIDFGAVKEVMSTVLSSSGALKSSLVIGTPGFMPPEQVAGHPVFASDLYSLGLTIVSLLTKRSPAQLPTDNQTGQYLWQQYAPYAPSLLSNVLTKAIHPEASQRYATASEMLAAIAPPKPQTPLIQPVPISAAQLPKSLPKPSASQTSNLYQKSAQKFAPSQDESNKLSVPTILAGIAFALLAGIGLFIQFGPQSQPSESIRADIQANKSQTEQTNTPDGRSGSDAQTLETQTLETQTLETQAPSSRSIPNTQPSLAEAQSLYEAGNNAAALEKIEQILDNNTAEKDEQVSAIALKADILANQTQRDLPGAVQLYTQALSISPDSLEILTKRCKAYAALKNWAAAESDCTQALDIDPSSVALYSRRGDIRTAAENHEGAVDDYTQAIELNANAGQEQQNQSLYFRRFTALGKLNRPEEALADMEKVRALPPTEPATDELAID